jgi:hypothetical protein
VKACVKLNSDGKPAVMNIPEFARSSFGVAYTQCPENPRASYRALFHRDLIRSGPSPAFL